MFKFIVMVLIIISLFIAETNAIADTIGTITEQSGPTEIQRDKKSIPSDVHSAIESNDTVVTAKSKTRITFKDDSLVEITEQSKLLIDDFVYDSTKTDAGKLGLKMALGTARFASGQIAKHTPDTIRIDTPTATIGVRGTDFTATVDETGRSLVVLLPSCPMGYKVSNIEKDCTVGEIYVQTNMGTVTLNKAFQATTVNTRDQKPAKPVILNLNPDQISNLLIVAPPKEVKEVRTTTAANKTALDVNFLDVNFFAFTGLDDAFLTQQSFLDMNMLEDSGFLANMLDLLNSQLLESELSSFNQMLPHYPPNKAAGLKYMLVDTNLTLYRFAPSHVAVISVDKDTPANLTLIQDGVTIKQTINNNNGTSITINQSR